MMIHHLRLVCRDSGNVFFLVTFCGCIIVETDVLFEVDRHFDFSEFTKRFKKYLDDFIASLYYQIYKLLVI